MPDAPSPGWEASAARVDPSGRSVTVEWAPTGAFTYQSAWLRQYLGLDHFDDVAEAWTDGANFSNQSWLTSTEEVIRKAELANAGETLDVSWSDGSELQLSSAFLWERSFAPDPVDLVETVPWGGGTTVPEYRYDDVMNDEEALYAFLHDYLAWGLLLVRDTPGDRAALPAFTDRIGTLCPSHLGDTFEIRRTARPTHIGEVTAEIPLHIDLVYRQETPSVQLLHALRQIDDGGANEFVDVRMVVRDLDPDDRRILSSTPVDFVASSSAVHFRGRHPILRFEHAGEFMGVFYNQYKIVIPPDAPAAFYPAFERFRSMIHSSRYLLPLQLPERAIAVFDNRRSLHGRQAFTDSNRHVIGCFANADDVRSRFRVLSRNRAIPPA